MKASSGAWLPACPDHSLKPVLFEMLGGHPGEVTLTENFAMLPTSAVSGFYFGYRDSQYFGVARIGRDQLKDYADGAASRRMRGTLASAEFGIRAKSEPYYVVAVLLAQTESNHGSRAPDPSRFAVLPVPAAAQAGGSSPSLSRKGLRHRLERGRTRHSHAAGKGLARLLAEPGGAGLPDGCAVGASADSAAGPLRYPVPTRLEVAA